MAARKRRGRRNDNSSESYQKDQYVMTCVCGKRGFHTRAAARKAARVVGGKHTSTYRCGRYYHWGHLQLQVIQGRSPVRVGERPAKEDG